LQSRTLKGAAPYALPLTPKLLPEYLNELGYRSDAVGKWHLGSYRAVYTPTKRGFRSHVGFWTGHKDYYDHTAEENYPPVVRLSTFVRGGGMDARRHGIEPGPNVTKQLAESLSPITLHFVQLEIKGLKIVPCNLR
jgi:arylsulfatase A-like enzyme